MKIPCIALALSISLTSVHALSAESAPEVEIPHGQVSMRFEEFRRLFESANKVLPTPEIDPHAACLSASYEIDWANREVVNAIWTLENFTDARCLVPVASIETGISPTPQNSAVFLANGNNLAVLLRTPGPQQAEAVFASNLAEHSNGRWVLDFPVVPAATNLLKLRNVPADLRVTVAGTIELPSNSNDRLFSLSAIEQSVRISVEQDRPATPSSWELRSEVLVTPGDLTLQFQARVTATLTAGDGRETRIPLPRNARGVIASAEGLRSWNTETDTDDTPSVVLHWADSAAQDRTIEIRYNLPVGLDAKSWTLSAPGAPARSNGNDTFVVLHSPTLELRATGQISKSADASLSGWMRERIRGKEFSIFQSVSDIEIALQWLPLVEPANLMVRTANFKSRIVPDGSQLTEAEVDVEYDTLTAWRCQLPASAKLLECSVDGVVTRPIRRDDAIEIPLEASGGSKKTRIRISYTDQGAAFDPVSGGLTLQLPVSPTFVHALRWAIELPGGYDIAGIESNASVVRASEPSVLELRRELIRGTPVLAEIFYRKQGLQQ